MKGEPNKHVIVNFVLGSTRFSSMLPLRGVFVYAGILKDENGTARCSSGLHVCQEMLLVDPFDAADEEYFQQHSLYEDGRRVLAA